MMALVYKGLDCTAFITCMKYTVYSNILVQLRGELL